MAQAEAAVANYASTALSAWAEIENAIAADRYLAEQESAQVRALQEAKLAEELALRKYTTSDTLTIFNLRITSYNVCYTKLLRNVRLVLLAPSFEKPNPTEPETTEVRR